MIKSSSRMKIILSLLFVSILLVIFLIGKIGNYIESSKNEKIKNEMISALNNNYSCFESVANILQNYKGYYHAKLIKKVVR